mgnify:CR=1
MQEVYYKVTITCINNISRMRSLVGQVLLIDYSHGPTFESDIFLQPQKSKVHRLKLGTDTGV